jgi:hypothetical protein
LVVVTVNWCGGAVLLPMKLSSSSHVTSPLTPTGFDNTAVNGELTLPACNGVPPDEMNGPS